jgi:biopolymer transport protein ExbB/TolQ
VRWVNSFRAGSEAGNPVLLAPMKALLSRSSSMALSTSSLRSILDSLATRLDESRDIARYLIGLLVFLGLLGTFWGLLQTIASIGTTIQSLDPGSGNTNDVLQALKAGLSAPLGGMGTAFSSSLLGLSGSLILGFLDLQASRAQNRFYTELENWLSSVTDLGSDIPVPDTGKAGPAEEIRALSERLRAVQETGGSNQRVAAAMANLADGISGLVKNMRSEQQMMRDWVEAQSDEQKRVRQTLEKLAEALRKREIS